MRILLLTTHINVGGIGVYTLNLAKYLKKSGHDVTIVSSGGELAEELTREGISSITIDIKTKFEFSVKVWKALPRLIKILKHQDIQIVHAQTRVAQVLSFLIQKISGVPFVTTCHGFFAHKRLSRRLLPCWGEKVIAISKSVEKHLVEDFKVDPGKVEQIYNGIELDRFLDIKTEKNHMLLEQMGLFADDIIIGSVGRLSPVKGFKYLIEGFYLIAEAYPKTKLLLVGEGPEEGLLRKKVDEYKLNDRAIFFTGGGLPEKYLPLFNVFCLPSVMEGLGLSIMEAMAAERTCIASNVGGIAELIDHEENGLLFEPENPEKIAEALERVLTDTLFSKKLASNARKKAQDNFSIKDTIEKTIDVYREVAGMEQG